MGNVGFTPAQLSYVYLLGGALTLFTSPLIGRLADRTGRQRVFRFLNLAAAPGLLLLTHLGRLPLLPVLVITTALFGVLAGRNVTATALITSVRDPASAARGLSEP